MLLAVRSSLCLMVQFCVFSPYWRRWHGGICCTSVTGGVARGSCEFAQASLVVIAGPSSS